MPYKIYKFLKVFPLSAFKWTWNDFQFYEEFSAIMSILRAKVLNTLYFSMSRPIQLELISWMLRPFIIFYYFCRKDKK